MGTELDLVFGLIGIGSGIYCLFSVYMMRKTGIICKSLFIDKVTEHKKCKDTGAFLVEVLPVTIILGIVTMLYGISILVNSFVVTCTIAVGVLLVAAFAVIVWFAVISNKAKKKYF